MRSRFSPQARGGVLQGLYAGLTLAEAAEQADLPVQTVKNWLTRGRTEAGTEHAVFAEAVDRARDAAATVAMTESEFRACLARAVRGGSTQAMKLWWSIHRGDEASAPDDDPEDPFYALDALDAAAGVDVDRPRGLHRAGACGPTLRALDRSGVQVAAAAAQRTRSRADASRADADVEAVENR